MLFYTGDMNGGSPSNTTHSISITNTFNVTVVVYNITLSPSARDMFTVSIIAANVDLMYMLIVIIIVIIQEFLSIFKVFI